MWEEGKGVETCLDFIHIFAILHLIFTEEDPVAWLVESKKVSEKEEAVENDNTNS